VIPDRKETGYPTKTKKAKKLRRFSRAAKNDTRRGRDTSEVKKGIRDVLLALEDVRVLGGRGRRKEKN